MFRSLLQCPWTKNSKCCLRMEKLRGLSLRRLSDESRHGRSLRNGFYYVLSIGVAGVGLSFAFVPAYRLFCEKTSYLGQGKTLEDTSKIAKMKKVEDRLIRVIFDAMVPAAMQWEFKPAQREIYVHPGETALAFYEAYNPTDRPIIGISSYNLNPFQAAFYFTKIQCFCFEEQILYPKERVNLPVFFYIDPEYAKDPQLEKMDTVTLSYTFFESAPDLVLPNPFEPPDQSGKNTGEQRGIIVGKVSENETTFEKTSRNNGKQRG